MRVEKGAESREANMKFVSTRPVTILSTRHGERWFPFLFRHADGSLLLYIQTGHDRWFAPVQRFRSRDGGSTWTAEQNNLPRLSWCQSFGDGELFEMDWYGFRDPKTAGTYAFYGAWGFPSDAGRPTARDTVRVHSPSAVTATLSQRATEGYPTYPWWPLYNTLHGRAELSGDEVLMGGPIITGGGEFDGRLLALGYMVNLRDEAGEHWWTYCFESLDRGRTWEEISAVGGGRAATLPNLDEATLVVLKNGQLYCVLRSGTWLYHSWSSDSGRSWSQPAELHLIDSEHRPRAVWPVCKVLDDGTLVLVYGRPGKHMVFDPSGTGRQWQGRLDLHAWELDTQELFGVPPESRLHGPTQLGVRYWDSGDYLGCVADGPREMLVCYDVQSYHEHWNAPMMDAAIRLVRVRLE